MGTWLKLYIMKAEGFLYTGKVEERVEGHFFFFFNIVGNREACHDGGRVCRRHLPVLPIAHWPGKDRAESQRKPVGGFSPGRRRLAASRLM